MQALEGYRILEMGTFGPATQAAGLLADLGMEVIRIEPPPHPSRSSTTSREVDGDGIPVPPGGVPWQRNKQSLVLNLKMPEAKEIFYNMVSKSDVVIEANRPGVLKRLGVDYETAKRYNSKIIYCSVTGYGQSGPYIHRPGHDANWQGVGGMLSLSGISLGNFGNPRNGPPAMPSRLVSHHTTPYYCAIAILTALWSREFTLRGQHLDISNCDAVVAVPNSPPRTIFEGGSPAWNVYETSDGKYIAIGARRHQEWEKLCRLLNREEYISHLDAIESKQAAMLQDFSALFKSRSRDEWWSLFKNHHIAGAPVNDLEEVEHDPQVKAREMMLEFDLPEGTKAIQYGIPIKFSMTPGKVKYLAQSYGQNTASILTSLGYSSEQINSLKASGAVM
ncbi:MAG: CoA transferase [Candidatus Tectomicrobia bacterium]|uniref:CoA transferase n=1 Tax=Tectimicrobiota bacterium TaxID=2528274 RepID=A0A933GJT7_UNCTE|nr:CoA transferase [Candidatus Tectomicrobia bacterium]